MIRRAFVPRLRLSVCRQRRRTASCPRGCCAWSVNLTGFHAGCGVPCVSRGRFVWSQAVVAWRISYSV